MATSRSAKEEKISRKFICLFVFNSRKDQGVALEMNSSWRRTGGGIRIKAKLHPGRTEECSSSAFRGPPCEAGPQNDFPLSK